MPAPRKKRSGIDAPYPSQESDSPFGRRGAMSFIVCVYLAGLAWFVFGQTLKHPFFNLDDAVYVSQNPNVTNGLTWRGIVWAFTHVETSVWTPLTTVSHMVDCQFFGVAPGGHHLTNVLLHIAAAILLFLVLRGMTGALWPGAFVAALFAVHPLRVESVAWVAERKDVLSGVFFLLALGAYARYAHRPSAGRYLAVFLLFGAGLLAKPMLVTLPVVLLLLDLWPLGRWRSEGSGMWGLFLEKVPLFALSAASCVVTLFGGGKALGNARVLISLPQRLGNAAVSCVTYMRQMFWPSGLALMYPFPAGGQPVWKIALSVLLLALLTTGAFLARKKRPYLLVGWLWYLVMLLPVAGIAYTWGREAHADRYTYLPQIGLYLALTWAAMDISASWPRRREILGITAVGLLAALALCARVQAGYWRDSETLWKHTLARTSGNAFAHVGLGLALLGRGAPEEAAAQYEAALKIDPDDADAHKDLGAILLQQGKAAEAVPHFEKALETKAGIPEAHLDLGYALLAAGREDGANAHFLRAFQMSPDDAQARIDVGNAFLRQGRADEALALFDKALLMDANNPDAHFAAGAALLATNQPAKAVSQVRTRRAAKTQLGGSVLRPRQRPRAASPAPGRHPLLPESPGYRPRLRRGLDEPRPCPGHLAGRLPPRRRKSRPARHRGRPPERRREPDRPRHARRRLRRGRQISGSGANLPPRPHPCRGSQGRGHGRPAPQAVGVLRSRRALAGAPAPWKIIGPARFELATS